MSIIPKRFKGVIELIGDDYLVSGNTRKAIVTILPSERAKDFLPQADIDASAKPMRLAYVPHDDATALSDTVAWDGLSLTVKKVVSARARGETVAKMLVWG
ncbi:MAG: hypothetical protein HZC36_04700 [Armatimonadetes bacterium]|nr:hypothetical protein [Armatimonadota bacterium]